MKRAHWFQHVPFEGLGSIECWLMANGYEVTYTRLFEPHALPVLDAVDFLIVMGGPMSVNDEADYPWLVAEKAFIRNCIDAGKPVLGICLGAQLIASVLGARVFPNSLKEIGWFPIEAVPSDAESRFKFPSSTTVFHWHGETFDLPQGAIRLAKSAGCDNQAFQYGEKVIGLQFHLETTPEAAEAIVTNCRHELIPAEYVQTEADILSSGIENYVSIHQCMDRILSHLCGGAVDGITDPPHTRNVV